MFKTKIETEVLPLTITKGCATTIIKQILTKPEKRLNLGLANQERPSILHHLSL